MWLCTIPRRSAYVYLPIRAEAIRMTSELGAGDWIVELRTAPCCFPTF